jgi:hypothetical protein
LWRGKVMMQDDNCLATPPKTVELSSLEGALDSAVANDAQPVLVEEEDEFDEDAHKDGPRAWWIVFCAAIVSAHTPGMHYIFGVMFVTLLDTFQQPRSVTAGIGAMASCVMQGGSLLSGMLQVRVHTLILTLLPSTANRRSLGRPVPANASPCCWAPWWRPPASCSAQQ